MYKRQAPGPSRELQRALAECASADEACAVLYDRAEEANEVNVAATLHRASRDGAGAEATAWLFRCCEEAAPRMRERQLANSARALGVLASRSPVGGEAARSREAAQSAVSMAIAEGGFAWKEAHEVAMASWACGSAAARAKSGGAKFAAARALLALAEAAAGETRGLQGYGSKEAADVVWALASARRDLLGGDEADDAVSTIGTALDSLGRHAGDPATRYRPRDVATCAWACARLGDGDWRVQAEARSALRALSSKVDAAFPPRDAARKANMYET